MKIKIFTAILFFLILSATGLAFQSGENVEFIGDALVSGYYYDVQVKGDYIYAVNLYGLMIFRLSENDSLILTGKVSTPGEARVLQIADSYAYIGDEQYGLIVVDISQPENPFIAGSYQISYDPATRGIFIKDHLLYLAARSKGLLIFNISNPQEPQLENIFDRQDYDAYGVWVKDSLAYIADYWEGLSVVNIKDLNNLFETSLIKLPGTLVDICIDQNFAYVAANDSGMRVLNITRPDSIYEVGSFCLESNSARTVFIRDTLAFIAYSYSGTHIVDISDPQQPEPLGSFGSFYTQSVFSINSRAFIADGQAGLEMIDVEDPHFPVEMSRYTPVGSVWSVFKTGKYAYLTGETRLLSIVDISNPDGPEVLLDWITPGFHAWDVYVRNSLAYIATYSQGLKIIDVTEPAHPVERGSYDTPSNSYGIDVVGDYAYVADSDSGLRIINIADPDAPYEVGYYDSVSVLQVDVFGDYAYLACANEGLYILDISDPENPFRVGSIVSGSSANDIHVLDDIACLAWHNLALVDVSDPTMPYLIDYKSTPGFTRGIYMQNNLSYTATTLGLYIYDITDTSHIVQVGYYETPGQGYKVCVSNDTILIADHYNFLICRLMEQAGLESVASRPIARFHLNQNYPNPFNPTTRIEFTLAKHELVAIEVYNTLGQKIATLFDKPMPPGHHEIEFNGKNLPSGVYYYRIKAGEFSQVRKMVLIK